jgi:cytochrome P450
VYPVVPFNYREALVDTTLPHGGGLDGRLPLFIKSGSYVFYCTYAMHRDPAIYGDDAMEFKPERWEDPALRPGWGYLPFNGGARTCIGRQ